MDLNYRNMLAESDTACTIIKVNMSDAYASSTMLKAYAGTKADELCAVIAHKLALTPAEIPLHHLILVFTVVGWTSRKHHTIKTLVADDTVLNVLEEVTLKQNTKHDNLEGKLNTYATWHYKDSLSHPLDADFDPDDDASGNSTSEEEEEISLSDVSYLRQNDRKGFMLKKSSKDPNLWRRRYCILTDQLWCIDAKRSIPRATSIDIFNNITLANNHTVEIPHSFALVRKQRRDRSSSGGTSSDQRVVLHDHYFRVQSEVSMASWMDELRLRIVLNRENEVMVLAEQIICDEEKSRYCKIAKAVKPLTDNYSIYCDPAYRGGEVLGSASTSTRTSRVNSFAPSPVYFGQEGVLSQNFRNSPAPPEPGGSISTVPVIGAAAAEPPVSIPAVARVRTATLARVDQSKPHVASHDNGDGGYSGVCVFGSSRFTNNVPSRLHKFHKHNTIEADIMSFLLAVGRFKEICRHDLKYSVQYQWERVCGIYNEFIVYQLLFNTHEIMPMSVLSSGESTPVPTRDAQFEGFPLEKKAATVGSPGGVARRQTGHSNLIWQLGDGRRGANAPESVLIVCLRKLLTNLKTVVPKTKGDVSSPTGTGTGTGTGRPSSSLAVSKTFKYRREDINAAIPPALNPYSALPTPDAEDAASSSSTTGSYWLWPSTTTATSPKPSKKSSPPLPVRTDTARVDDISAAATLDLAKIPEFLSVSGTNATHDLLDTSQAPSASLFDPIVEALKFNKLYNISEMNL